MNNDAYAELDAEFKEHEKTVENWTTLDTKFYLRFFDKLDRVMLAEAQRKNPNSIVRLPLADLIADGSVNGLGGSIPKNWDGSIVQL